jgi:hypothetical protein
MTMIWIACTVGGSAAAISPLSAQVLGSTRDSVLAASHNANLTRADLDGLIRQVGRLERSDSIPAADRRAYALLRRDLRDRLISGDFRAGDEILLRVEGEEGLSGTFYVREGQLLSLPTLGDVSLRGVLHAELREHLVGEIGRFVRNPEVHATALVRIAVLGEVRNPGYYRLAADVPLSDALMAAGGPTADADLGHAVVRRNAAEVLAPRLLSQALSRGATLDQLDVRAGDELFVGQRHRWNWQATLQSGVAVVGVLISYQLLHRR